MLSSFDAGWQSLSPELKVKWVTHPPKGNRHHSLETWKSWTVYAFSNMMISKGWQRKTESLSGYLVGRMRYAGELFGIPEEFRIFGPEPASSEEDEGDEEDDEEGEDDEDDGDGILVNVSLKDQIAERFTQYFLGQIKEECEQWVKDTVASGGVGALKPLLEADSVLDVIANSRVNEKRTEWKLE
jgi:hypothetical protein